MDLEAAGSSPVGQPTYTGGHVTSATTIRRTLTDQGPMPLRELAAAVLGRPGCSDERRQVGAVLSRLRRRGAVVRGADGWDVVRS